MLKCSLLCRQMVKTAAVEDERLKSLEEKLSKSLQKYLLNLRLLPKLDGQVKHFHVFCLSRFCNTTFAPNDALALAQYLGSTLLKHNSTPTWVHTCRAACVCTLTGISTYYTCI